MKHLFSRDSRRLEFYRILAVNIVEVNQRCNCGRRIMMQTLDELPGKLSFC